MGEWWRKVRGKPTAQAMATQQVEDAKMEIVNVRKRITEEVDALKREQMMYRGELQQAVHSRAPQEVLLRLTKKLKQVENQIREKEKLMSNVHRESSQLSDAGTNAKVAAAYMQSVEAQKALAALHLGGGEVDDVDDMLDDVEWNRERTRELTDRLGSLGGTDNDLLLDFDDDEFDATTVMEAMGLRTDRKEELMVAQCKEMLKDSWQPSLEGMVYSSDTSTNIRNNMRQRHVPASTNQPQEYHLPDPPSTHYTSAEKEKKEFESILQHALAAPRTEY